MAILENRVKTHSKSYNLMLMPLFVRRIFALIQRLTIIGLAILMLSANFLKLDSHLLDANGLLYQFAINPTKTYIQKSINIVVNFMNFSNLHAENILLKIENAKLSSLVDGNIAVNLENEKLKKAYNISFYKPESVLKASVIYSTLLGEESIGVISAGSESGIQKNDIVTSNGLLVGRIVTVGKNYSRISLVNSNKSRIPVTTNKTHLKAILVGSDGRGGYLIHLNSHHKPQVGEILETSGDGENYPKGIPVAKIDSVAGEDVMVKILCDLNHLDLVEIININQYLK
ncbi:MAG: rod shape-determining protein MreC [Rickettsiaceae bacterium]|nr:rod shape-determining protein MreC [Rickettsiaceae bacterium]